MHTDDRGEERQGRRGGIGIGALGLAGLAGLAVLVARGRVWSSSSEAPPALAPELLSELEPVPERPRTSVSAPTSPAPPAAALDPRRVPDPARIASPAFVLQVRDARTRRELSGLELFIVPNTTLRAGWRRPEAGEPVVAVASEASSPVTIATWRHAGDAEDVARGYDWSDVSGKERSLELARTHPLRRGFALYARDADHAWGRILVDPWSASVHELLLVDGADLDVTFANPLPAAYAALDPEPHVFVRRTDVESSAIVRVQPLTAALAGSGLSLAGMEPGAYRVSVEVGKWTTRDRTVLAHESFDLAAGEAREVSLYLAEAR